MNLKKILIYAAVAIVSVPVLLIAVMFLLRFIGFNRPPPIPLHNPQEAPPTIWYDQTHDIALVSDAEGNYYGLNEEGDILFVDFQFIKGEYDENVVTFYSTGADELKDAVLATARRDNLPTVCVGTVWIHSWNQSELGITLNEKSMSENGKLDFSKVMPIAEDYLFREAENWPPEMLEWIEQQSG